MEAVEKVDLEYGPPVFTEINFEQIAHKVLEGGHGHIGFLIGSWVSVGAPSLCPDVGTIRRQMVLDHLTAIDGDCPGVSELVQLIQSDASISKQVAAVPFEQFMECLHKASPKSADAVVRAACGSQHAPNANHRGLASLAHALVERGLKVSVLTTNYDTCIDTALQERFGTPAKVPLAVPAYQWSAKAAPALRYAKLHGCIEKGLMVFTFEQMSRLLFNERWHDQLSAWLSPDGAAASLWISAGYGYWDPDLRPLLLRLMSGATLIRNEQPLPKDKPIAKVPRSPSGPDGLQAEFFQDLHMTRGCQLLLYRSSLVAGTNDRLGSSGAAPPILVGLAQVLTGGAACSSQPPSAMTADDRRILSAAIQGDLAGQLHGNVAAFLGRLLDAAGSPAPRAACRAAIHWPHLSAARWDVARSYLFSFGNDGTKTAWQQAVQACQELAHDHEHTVRAVARSYESLALSVGQFRVLPAIWASLRARGQQHGCQGELEAFLGYYQAHLIVKSLSKVTSTNNAFGRALSGSGIAYLLARHEDKVLRELFGQSREIGDVRLVGDALALLAETQILMHSGDSAVGTAARAVNAWALIGRANNAALADRLQGWSLLARDGSTDRTAAVGVFARGTGRSVDLNDRSVRCKLGANFVRAFWSGAVGEVSGCDVVHDKDRVCESANRLARVLDNQVRRGRRVICTPGRLMYSKDALVLAGYTRALFGDDWPALVTEMERHSDLRRYPIYHPLVPGIEG